MRCRYEGCSRPVPPYFARKHMAICIRHQQERTRGSRQRYWQSAKGKAASKRRNDKRVYIGRRYAGLAKTHEQQATVQAHIRRRLDEYNECRSLGKAAKSRKSKPCGAQNSR